MINLRVSKGHGWETIFPRLSCLETLTLEEINDEPNIHWRNLKDILLCRGPCFNVLPIISCVQSLEIISIFSDNIVDCNQLLPFPNLSNISLFGPGFVNFDAILKLPKSTKSVCRTDLLTTEQLAIWNQSCEFIK